MKPSIYYLGLWVSQAKFVRLPSGSTRIKTISGMLIIYCLTCILFYLWTRVYICFISGPPIFHPSSAYHLPMFHPSLAHCPPMCRPFPPTSEDNPVRTIPIPHRIVLTGLSKICPHRIVVLTGLSSSWDGDIY